MRGGQKIATILVLGFATYGCAAPAGPVGSIELISGPSASRWSASTVLPPQAPALANGQVAAVPAGFISFCTRFADQCSAPAEAPSTITLAADNWLTLQEVNQSVNRAIRPMDDERHYGRKEYWNIPSDGYGDCEDYALTKRSALIAAGFPQPALRVAIVVTPRSERHAVLTVTTDRGDYVLDNLKDTILSWDQAGYRWIERQDANNAWGWVALGSSPDLTYVASIAASPLGETH
jgi:predicted transglutaminase-like cysteine proteinase